MLLLSAGAALAAGKHVHNEGDGRVSYVARADCAAAAAAVLTSDGHDHKIYDITGPAALNADDVARLFADLAGRPVEAIAVDDEAFISGLVEHAHMPEPAARGYATFGVGARRGYSTVVSDTVQDLTGRAPMPVRELLSAHPEAFAQAA